jgi:hypothetical protein
MLLGRRYVIGYVALSSCCSSHEIIVILKQLSDLYAYVCMYARTHVEVPTYTIELLVFTSAVKRKQYVNYAM